MSKVQLIPAISIRQPWAELILRNKKTIEVRSWDSAYRGILYLHTGKIPAGYKVLEPDFQGVFLGGYVGTIELAAIVPFTEELWEQWREMHLSDGQFREGLFAWMIKNPKRFKNPIPGSGALGIFNPDPSVRELLDESPFINNTQG